MKPVDYFTITAILSAVISIFGWWLKTRLDTSIRHEYDRLLELFKADQRRSDILNSERLVAFKVLSEKLLGLRRYCYAKAAELNVGSEFEPTTDSLSATENISLLQHSQRIERSMEERELFFSASVRAEFDELFSKMSMGFNLEIWLLSGGESKVLNAAELYNSIGSGVNDVMSALYRDLGFVK